MTNGAYNGNAFSPKYYKSGWTGGSSVRIKTYKVSNVAQGIGNTMFGINTVWDGYGVYKYYKDPGSEYAVSPGEAAFNFGLGVYSIRVNPAIGILVSGVSAFYPGGWLGNANHAGAIKDQSKMIDANRKIISDFNMYRDRYGKQ